LRDSQADEHPHDSTTMCASAHATAQGEKAAPTDRDMTATARASRAADMLLTFP
jgi:hypothetical protein